MIYLSEQQKKDIGLEFVLDKLSVLSPFGVERVKEIRPFTPDERDLLTSELDNIGRIKEAYEAHRGEFSEMFHILSQFKDIRQSINKIASDESYVLDEIELFELKNFLLSLKELVTVFKKSQKFLNLSDIPLREIPPALAILDPDGKELRSFYISESTSKTLKSLRIEKRRLEAEITSCKDDTKKQLLREERLLVVCAEEDEELKIRKELTKKLLPSASEFFENTEAIGLLDLLLQKGKLAAEHKTTRATFAEREIRFQNVYNPHVAYLLERRGKEFTPVSITLKGGTAVLTGANMGGKSVALKTFTLNILLFQMGFFVFADKAELPLFDYVHLVSEDLQSVDKGLSTFAAEIVKLRQISVDLNKGFAFIALDEFARGTNPREGAGLARAVARYLNQKNAISIITTHYDNVSSHEFSNYQVVGLKNLDLDKLLLAGAKTFSLISEHMDYSLQMADPDSEPPRDALNICRLLNLTDDILRYYDE